MKKQQHLISKSYQHLQKHNHENELEKTLLTSSVDASKLSNEKAAMIVTSLLESVGCDPTKFNVNRSSFRWQHIKKAKIIG